MGGYFGFIALIASIGMICGIVFTVYRQLLINYIAGKHPEKYKEIFDNGGAWFDTSLKISKFLWNKEILDDKKVEQLKQKHRLWFCLAISLMAFVIAASTILLIKGSA